MDYVGINNFDETGLMWFWAEDRFIWFVFGRRFTTVVHTTAVFKKNDAICTYLAFELGSHGQKRVFINIIET